MLESFLAALLALYNSPYFVPVLSFILGWLGLGQPEWMVKIRDFLLGIKDQLGGLDVIINAIDAILKANGVVPADAPRLTAKEVKAVLDGSVNVDTLAKAQRAKLAAMRSDFKG
jgi:hypothetical protein